MKKIGIVTTWFDRGAAYVSKQYADVLNEQNEVYIFARGGEQYAIENTQWHSYNVTWSKIYSDSSTRINWRQFKSWVEKNRIEIVLFNEQQDWEIIVDCRKLNIKIVAYIDYYKKSTIPFFDLYDAVICNTQRHFSVFNTHRQSFHIPWGTDVEIFKPSSNKNIASKIPIFFHSAGMGGVNLRKGTDILVRAFNKIQGDAKLIIHSQTPLDRFNEVKEIIVNNENIEFICNTCPPPGLYHLGNVYVYPTKLEGIGLTICEALAMGMPVITTNCAPMNEFVEHKKTGILVDVESYLGREDGYYWAESVCSEQSLLDALMYFVQDSKKTIELGKVSRETAVAKFDWSNNSLQLNSIFNNIRMDKLKNETLNKLKNSALGYSFDHRVNGTCFANRVFRKITREFYNLTDRYFHQG